MRYGTVKKLAVAQEKFKSMGYYIKIWDAYRPVSAQKRLFEVYPDPKFVAKPNPNFSHQKGVTFDLTLTDMKGREVEMQTGFDDFTEHALRNAKRTPLQEEHYQILDKAMTEAGFIGYVNEWWDYRDSQMDEYEPLLADPNDYKI